MPAGKNHQQGFNLVELLTVLVVLLIIIGLGAPAYQKMQQRNELLADYNRFLAGIRQARSEAVRRQEDITFTTEMKNDGNWSFSIRTSGAPDETLLARHHSTTGRVKISEGTLTFDRLGRLKPGSSGCSLLMEGECTFTLERADSTRSLTVLRTGRIKVESNA